MSPEERVLIERVLELEESNNKMLRSLYRTQNVNRIFKAVYWGAIIILTIGSYYALQPYLDLVKNNFDVMKAGVENASESLNKVNSIKSNLDNLLGN